MDTRLVPLLYVFLGLLVVTVAATALSPVDDRPMYSTLVEHESPDPSETDVAYDELSSETQAVVDQVIRSGGVSLSTYEDYAVLEELPRKLAIERNGETYVVRTTSADGDGGLFEGLLHDVLLAVGGLVLGAGGYVIGNRRRIGTVATFPVLATVTVAGVNLLRAPDPSVLNWYYLLSFGSVVAVPVIAGIAARRRDLRIAAIGLLTLLLSIAVLLQGDRLSPLPHVIGLAVLAIPGVIGGWWLGNAARHVTRTDPRQVGN